MLSTIVYPQLTTVEPPLAQMGKTAAEMILEKIKSFSAPNRTLVFDAEIKIRASTGISRPGVSDEAAIQA